MLYCPYCKRLGVKSTPVQVTHVTNIDQRILDQVWLTPNYPCEFYRDVREELEKVTNRSWLDKPLPPIQSGTWVEIYCPECETFGAWMKDYDLAKRQFIEACDLRVFREGRNHESR